MNRRRFLIILGGSLVAGVSAVTLGGRRVFEQQINHEIARLLALAQPPTLQTVSESDLPALPAPVQRWMRTSGVPGSAVPSVVRLRQGGEFRLGQNRSWMPYRATEYFTTNPPGFLWSVSMEMFPLVQVTGRDRYVQGNADIEMRIASLIPVAQQSGGELNQGALLRYLNETMWFPAALLLPSVTWEPVDDASARATLADAGQSVSAVFHFDAQDRLIDMTANRWNDAEQTILPWSTPLSAWGISGAGIAIPTAGTGVWNTGADAYEYIRLHVSEVEYDPPDSVRMSFPTHRS